MGPGVSLRTNKWITKITEQLTHLECDLVAKKNGGFSMVLKNEAKRIMRNKYKKGGDD